MNAWTNAENHYAASDAERGREAGALIWLTPPGTDWGGGRSQRHTSQRIQTENAFKPTLEGQIMFNLCTKLYLRSFCKVRKNWQHCSQEFYWRMWIDSSTRQIAAFLLPGDSLWPMKRGWCHLWHFWVEARKAQVWLSSLFFLPQRLHVPDGACARASLITNICRLWWVCVCVCGWVCVFVCMSVYVWAFDSILVELYLSEWILSQYPVRWTLSWYC